MSDPMELPAVCVTARAGVAVGDSRAGSASAGWGMLPDQHQLLRTEVSVASASALGVDSGFGMAGAQSVEALWLQALAAVPLSSGNAMAWNTLRAIDLPNRQYQQQAAVQYFGGWQIWAHTVVVERAAGAVLPQLCVDMLTVRPSEYALRQSELHTDLSALLALDDGPYIPSGRITWGDYELTRRPAAPMASGGILSVHRPAAREDSTLLPWGVGVSLSYQPDLPYRVEPEPVGPGEYPSPDYSEVYIIVNTVNVYALPGMEPLSVADISLQLDQDSYSWKFSAAVLNAASVELMKPDASGYKQALIEINGHQWVVFITQWDQSRKISGNKLDKRFSVSGYSRTQYLGQPFAPKRTRSIGTTTAVQAATDELVGTGFTLDWDVSVLPDWAMPNASYSYQELTPLQAIKRLAGAVGAVVQPGMASDVVVVRPRFAVLPWNLIAANMDRTIHEAQVLTEGGTLESRPLVNSVFVCGEREGVALSATRQGTAGDRAGADVVEAWLTDQSANVSRAAQEMAGSGDRIIHTIELAIPESAAQPGLLVPGLTVAVVHGDSGLDYRAYVQSVSISVPGRGSARVRQSVVLDQPVGWE
jgi:hypothetical protein